MVRVHLHRTRTSTGNSKGNSKKEMQKKKQEELYRKHSDDSRIGGDRTAGATATLEDPRKIRENVVHMSAQDQELQGKDYQDYWFDAWENRRDITEWWNGCKGVYVLERMGTQKGSGLRRRTFSRLAQFSDE